jgi:hypothetical protein
MGMPPQWNYLNGVRTQKYATTVSGITSPRGSDHQVQGESWKVRGVRLATKPLGKEIEIRELFNRKLASQQLTERQLKNGGTQFVIM